MEAESKPAQGQSPVRIAVIALLAIAVGVIAYQLLSGDDGGGGEPGGISARIVTPSELQDLVEQVGHPVYWVGVRPNTEIEFTEEEDGRVIVRYLTGDAEAGTTAQNFLAVGTYQDDNAVAGLRQQATEPGQLHHNLRGGGIVVSGRDNPRNAYVAYEGSDYQIEVYDPQPAQALGLALTGAVVPVP